LKSQKKCKIEALYWLFSLQDVGMVQLRSIKDKLRHFFEYGDGAQCNITSLFFCQKLPGSSAPGTLGAGGAPIVI
jgi:hypothetical protein